VPKPDSIQVGPKSIPLLFVHNPKARRYLLRLRADGVARVTIPKRGSISTAKEFAGKNIGWLIPRGQINHFAAHAPVLADGPPAEWAFLALSGGCQLRRTLPEKAGAEILRIFRRGETFDGFLPPDSCLRANVVLQPDNCDDRWLDYRLPGQYIRAGREIALRQLDEIKSPGSSERIVL
jgi:hypothetical protein